MQGRRLRAHAPLALALALAIGAGCRDEPEARVGPATARWQRFEQLQARRERVRDAADADGRAWVERAADQPDFAVSATPDRFEIVFETGRLGIARGGLVVFRPPLVGGWSIPQVDRPDARGYTRAETTALDVELDVRAGEAHSVSIRIGGRGLREGEQVRIHYGAGPGMVRSGRYADRHARFWIGVDGNADGSFGYLEDSPGIEVRPGPAAAMVVNAASSVRPGAPARVTLALIDAQRNATTLGPATLQLRGVPTGLQVPEEVVLVDGRAQVDAMAAEAGVYRVHATAGRLRATGNPIVVRPTAPALFWADLHGHSGLSDGTGRPEDYFRYARDTAGLDIVALTDHDHLGPLPLDEAPERWAQIRRNVERFHEPGRFVTLLGFEWTNWIHGHRHVLYFDAHGEVLSAMDAAYRTPTQLWDALRDARASALTFAHHPAGGPVAIDWSFAPDPEFEPVAEITSILGSSEAPDSPLPIENPVAGNFVRDALDRGYRLGFVGSGDTHDGHPGVTHVGYASGGLAAIAAETLTRSGVLEALRARRVYATSGERIVLQVDWNGQPMGSRIGVANDGASDALRIHAAGTAPIERIELIRSGGIVESIAGDGRSEMRVDRRPAGLRPGEYLYVRVVQSDGAAAWSSPFFFESR